MSDAKKFPDPNPSRTRRWVTALLILLGSVALLPGVCSFLFTQNVGGNPIAAVGFLIGLGGLAAIGMAIARMFGSRPATQTDERGYVKALLITLIVLVVLLAAFILWLMCVLSNLGR